MNAIIFLAVLAGVGLQGNGALAPPHALTVSPVEVIHNFGDYEDGSYPDTDLAVDSAGNFYGTTVQGGTFGAGTVFQLSNTPQGWAVAVLHNFTGGADGGQPYKGVTVDAQGNLYGTAVIGGSGGVCVEEGCGVAWQLTQSEGLWTHTVIHDFTGADGFGPGGPLAIDDFGNLYGMTPVGGDFGVGVIFQLSPEAGGGWTRTVIHHFTGGLDGSSGSAGRLIVDAALNLFGVATVGGEFGVGTVFQLTPSGPGTWTLTTLYAFNGQPDGVFPYGGLVRDGAGNLYGTTYYGGDYGVGVVYMLRNVGGVWLERVLHHFRGGRDGASSISTLVFGLDGNLYGTSSEGGSLCNCGTIFKLVPTANGGWKESVVHRFSGSDGRYPYAGLVLDSAGSMYGTAVFGGPDDDGTIFRLNP